MNSTLVATPPPPPRCESPLRVGPAHRSASSPVRIGTGRKDVCAERGRNTRRPAPSGSLRLRLGETERVTQHPCIHPSICIQDFLNRSHRRALHNKAQHASTGARLSCGGALRVMKPRAHVRPSTPNAPQLFCCDFSQVARRGTPTSESLLFGWRNANVRPRCPNRTT